MSHSPNLGLLDQEAAMQNIDRLIEALEIEAKESSMSKCRKLFSDEPSNSALQVYQPLDREEPSSSTVQVYQPLERSNVSSFPNFGITLEELSMLSRDKVFPYVNTHKLKTDGILKISGWVVDDFKKFSLEGHPDGYALDKQAIVGIVHVDFLAIQATTRHEPLLLEARNAFTNTRAEWDNEKGELVREREALKEELNKAKEMAIEVEQRTEAV
ncbi:hypothetical protein R1flu_005571 [Riccia fluitans]|uniref:Uncharacterized protein n=1 Tax=Riccia fluitans TaxID=41844 RepID=A0ABD1YWI7_9MARC